jgi:hypothetical protein
MNEPFKMTQDFTYQGHPTVNSAMELSQDSTFSISQSRLTQYRNDGCGGGKRRSSPNYKSMPWPQLESNAETSVYDVSPEGDLATSVMKGVETVFDGASNDPMKGSIAPVGDDVSLSKTINHTGDATYGSSLTSSLTSSLGSLFTNTKIAAMGAMYDLINYDQISSEDYGHLYGNKLSYIFHREERAPSLATCSFVLVILIVLMSYLLDA